MAYDAEPLVGDHVLATFAADTYVPDVGGGDRDVVEFVSLGFVVPDSNGTTTYQIQTAAGIVLCEFAQGYDIARFSPVSFGLYGMRSHRGFRVVVAGKACPGNLSYRLVTRG